MKAANLTTLGYVTLLDSLRIRSSLKANEFHIAKAMQWLCRAQDSTDDGGVSEGFHLYHGWLPSYPATTGYIIETFLDYHRITDGSDFRERAIRMADWLLEVQQDDGAIPDSSLTHKMVFDTGQVIFGLVRAFEETEDEKYKDAAVTAGEWLVEQQEEDGTWKQHALDGIPHTYYTRVAWSLAELHRVTGRDSFLAACKRNVDWAIGQQQRNGWFDKASATLKNHPHPFTHTIAYTARGILEVGLYTDDDEYVRSAAMAMNGVIDSIPKKMRLPGTYNSVWRGEGRFNCLTGNAQLAIILLKLHKRKGDSEYFIAAKRINKYLKCRQQLKAWSKNIRGAIAGSYPIWGKYLHFTYPNWAAKFFVDALLLGDALKRKEAD
jgi:rhamnogalacturonyl hydrolase YesR